MTVQPAHSNLQMELLENFAIKDGCAFYRPRGVLTPESIVKFLKQGLHACQAHGLNLFLLDLTQVSSTPFSTLERFQIVTDVQRMWDRTIRLAILNPADLPPPDAFALNIAHSRAVPVALFYTEQDAMNWLQQ